MFLASAIAAIAVGGPVYAHSQMSDSIPANMTSAREDLDTLQLKFNRKVRLTVVEVSLNEQKAEVEFPKGFVKEAEVKFQNLGIGCYDWRWIAVAQDGHTMEGMGHFELTTTPQTHTCNFELLSMQQM